MRFILSLIYIGYLKLVGIAFLSQFYCCCFERVTKWLVYIFQRFKASVWCALIKRNRKDCSTAVEHKKQVEKFLEIYSVVNQIKIVHGWVIPHYSTLSTREMARTLNFHPSTAGFSQGDNHRIRDIFDCYRNDPVGKPVPITGAKPRHLMQLHPIADQRTQVGKRGSWMHVGPGMDARTSEMQKQLRALRDIQSDELRVRSALLSELVRRKWLPSSEISENSIIRWFMNQIECFQSFCFNYNDCEKLWVVRGAVVKTFEIGLLIKRSDVRIPWSAFTVNEGSSLAQPRK